MMRSHTTMTTLAATMLSAVATFTTNGGLTGDAYAQETKPRPTTIQGITKQPSEAARHALLDPNDTVVLLLDHQTGLFQTVKDIPVEDLRRNTVVLAKAAGLGKAPIITTASEPNGTNGPLMSELEKVAPSARYVARKGEVSAWDNADFVKAVESTGRSYYGEYQARRCIALPADRFLHPRRHAAERAPLQLHPGEGRCAGTPLL